MRLTGTAQFFPSPGGLDFEERGVMALGTYQGESSRRYRFSFPTSLTADVRFESGAFFHTITLDHGRAQVRHDCTPDLYEGRYRILDADRWLLSWRVTGPRKHLRIASRFRRSPETMRIP
jgi:hypothetical protein